MIYPNFLKQGSKILVPAPSDGSNSEMDIARYKNAKSKIQELGYDVELSENIFCSKNGRSASAKARAEEINKMLDQDADLIWCATGGEFLVEILPYINFEKISQKPKWIEGFSDPTGILFPVTTKYDVATIYGNNFKRFGASNYHKSLQDNLEILKGNLVSQNSYELFENERVEKVTGLEGYNLTDKVEWKSLSQKDESFSGRIVAGCIDIIAELAGTRYDGTKSFVEKYKNDGIIWAFDDCDLSKEELIRTLWKLNEFGYFKHVNGIIFGRCGNENTYLGYNMETCIKDSVLGSMNVPIIYDADISHKGPSMTIINGAIAKVNYSHGKGSIEFNLI